MDCLKDIMNIDDKIDYLYKYTPMFSHDKFNTDYNIMKMQKERNQLTNMVKYYMHHIIEYGHKLNIIEFNNSIIVCNKYEDDLYSLNLILLYNLKNYNELIQDDLLKIKRNNDMKISMMESVIDYKMHGKMYIADSNFMWHQYKRQTHTRCVSVLKDMIIENNELRKIIYKIKI